jgi:hypothetical protein
VSFWACLRTEVRREDVAVRHLQLAGYQIYLPRLRTWRVSHGRKIEVHPCLFPSYLLLQI